MFISRDLAHGCPCPLSCIWCLVSCIFCLMSYVSRLASFVLCLVSCIAFFTGCSTGKNTTGTRAYHELTTRYNIYYNAEKAYHEIMEERSGSFREDYAELLPFYPFPFDTDHPVPDGSFDPVIDKTGKAIQAHSITAKPRRDPARANSQEYRQWLRQEEFNPFIKNVWLLRGKAYLQNGNFDEALSVFSGMLRLYGHDNDLVSETEIWMLRTYTEMGRNYDAEKTAYVLKNKKLPENLEKLFNAHYTFLLIRRKDYTEAIPRLRETIAQESDHSQKRRLQFLLGQIYALNGENGNAYRAFEEVKGLSSPFEITLNATLWQSALSSGEQQQKRLKQLKKMEQKTNITDSVAFFDRYYRVYLKTGNDSLAFAYRPSRPDNDTTGLQATWTAEVDSVPASAPQRFSQGRTLAENAALHRQWRFGNSLGASQSDGSMNMRGDQTIPFSLDKSAPHYLLLTFSPGLVDKNRLLFTTANFNFSHFKQRNFNISFIAFPSLEALQIASFRSLEEASRYTGMMLSDSLFQAAGPLGVKPVIISEENLKLIRSGQGMDEYNTFFANNSSPVQMASGMERKNEAEEIKEKNEQKSEKIVSLEDSVRTEPVNLAEQISSGEMLPVMIPKREEIPLHRDSLHSDGKIMPGETTIRTGSAYPLQPTTPEALKQRLEENAAKAMQQYKETIPNKSRDQLLKQRERQRKEKLKQRERELKEKQRQREKEIKLREKERKQKIRKQR